MPAKLEKRARDMDRERWQVVNHRTEYDSDMVELCDLLRAAAKELRASKQSSFGPCYAN